MVQQLLNRLDTGGPEGSTAKDHRLSRKEISLSTEAFNEFDNDGDGTLDGDELMQYLSRGEPAFEIIVRLGIRSARRSVVEFVDRLLTSNGKPGLGASLKPYSLEVVDRRAAGPGQVPRVRTYKGDDTQVTLDLDHVLVDLRTEDNVADLDQARQIFDSQFERLDADKSESISVSEVRGREPFQSLFTLIDRNGDSQIRKPEIGEALALLGELSRRQAVLGVADRGVLLFGNLDEDGDGRLAPRELRAAGERLASFDRNSDGQVNATEIPHRFEWYFSQAPIPLGFPVRVNSRMMVEATERGTAGGPAWFQKMDRNHDGDLSPREFLGPRADFLRLDADGDGLVNAREATGKN
jgi:Ca2+-binding EF-hand superfamily protein